MNGVGASKLREHHFTSDEEDSLRHEKDAAVVVGQARLGAGIPGSTPAIRGNDKSWREVKNEQRDTVGTAGGAHIAGAFVDGVHIAGVDKVEALMTDAGLAAGIGVAGTSVLGLGLGMHQWAEAHVKGEEQNAAIVKDQMHVALIGTLALPDGYKTKRFGDYPDVDRNSSASAASKMTAVLAKQPKAQQALQLHADRGMNAADDMLASGMTPDAFRKANPKVAEAYAKDAAFHEGFDAMVWAKQDKDPEAFAKAKADLQTRDGWYAQSNVNIRV